MSKRILFVHNYYQIGGGEHTVFENEKQLLADAGHMVVPYTRTNDELKGSLTKLLLLPFTTIFSLRTYREVKRLIREQGIDLVHCHNTFPLISPAVYYAAWRMKIPVVQTIHNFRLVCPSGLCFREGTVCEECLERKGFGPALRHRCYRDSWLQTAVVAAMLRVHRILGTYQRLNCIFLTEFNRDKIASFLRLPVEKQFVKANFCFQRAKVCTLQEVDGNKFIYVGRLYSNKGILPLARLWQALPKEFVLRLYGEGPLGDELDSLAVEHPNIQLAGFQEQKAFFEDWRTACALVFPSCCYEGLPMVLLESFSMGVPVLVNNMGNHGALVDEGKTGAHFSLSDFASLETAIQQVRENQETLKEACLEAYQQQYTPQKVLQEQERIYEAALSGVVK